MFIMKVERDTTIKLALKIERIKRDILLDSGINSSKKIWGKKTSYNFGSLTIVDIFIFEFIIITKINIKSIMEKIYFIWIFCVHD